MLKTCVLIGLHWAEPMMFFFFTRHMLMHCSCIHTFSFSYLVLFVDGVFLFVSLSSLSLSLSLSLSHIVRAWHPSTKLLCPRTLSFLGHHVLILLLFLSGSAMRRPVKTSLRTSPNMAFIQNAM